MMDMTKDVIEMLEAEANAQKKKGLLSLKLLTKKSAGIGDHSTEDFYKNAKEALEMIVDATDKLEVIDMLKNENWDDI
jgi:flagellar motor component MotA